MHSALRKLGAGLAAVGISFAATIILVLAEPDRAITLLIYLPGIVIVDGLFGLWAGVFSVVLSVAGSASYRIWYFPSQVQVPRVTFYSTWEAELILLLVGFFVVVLMELRGRSGARAAVGAHQLAAVLDHVGDAVLIFDRGMELVSMNPAAHQLLHQPGQTLVGQSAQSLRQRFDFISERTTASLPTLEEVTRAGLTTHEEGTVIDREQDRRTHVQITSTPWRNADDEIEGAIVVLTDVTALQDMQMRALDNARHVAVAEMISGLSHDFNHVLDIVRRGIAVLDVLESAPAPERRKYREMIDKAALDGGQIIRRLRDYLAGGPGPATAVDLVEVARAAVALTRPLWRSRTALEVVEDFEPVPLVQGSANDLQRVLVNLIFNAVEALGTGPGRITIRTRARPGTPPVACAEVEDTGPGVTPEAQETLFQAYRTTKPHGMGLGLFGASKIARAHRGSLRFEPAAVQGARFVLELPARAQPKTPASAPDASPQREIA
ncbi:MAG: ATP-binding protein [Terriglobales bacterium]